MIYLINKRPVNVFKCLQAALETLLEALKRCSSYKRLSKYCECVCSCLACCFYVLRFVFTNEQSPDALASGLWNGEFGGDLLSHG